MVTKLWEELQLSKAIKWDNHFSQEPPSPLISWVNPFPSRFINRTACFPRKVSYFRESRMSPWKKLSWMKSNSEARPSTVFLFYYTSIFTVLQPLGSGMKKKLMNYPAETEHEAMGQRQHWGSRKGSLRVFVFVCFVFFAVIHPTFKHAPWKESTLKRSVDDLECVDDQRRESARIIWFFVITVEWISPVKHRVQKAMT